MTPLTRDDFDGRSALVTGGSGLIGAALVTRLVASGARVRVLDSLEPDSGATPFNLASVRDAIEFHQGDVRDAAMIESLVAGQDYVFTLAAQTSHVGSMQDPPRDVSVNVLGQLNVLEACRKSNPRARLVFASTRQVYGTPDYLPVDESHPVRPPDINGVSKLAAEEYQRIYAAGFGLSGTVLRLTNTYGPGMRIRDARQTFVGVWLRRAIEGERFQVFGDGLQRRDFNFVEDVVDAFLLAATSPVAIGRTYNLGAPQAPTLLELADLIVALAPGTSYEIVPFPPERRSIDIGSCYSSYARIERELGWRPRTELRDGLARSLEFYRSNFDHYVSTGKTDR